MDRILDGLRARLGGQGESRLRLVLKEPLIAAAFNEWMRQYVEHPEEFEREWKTVGMFLAETFEDKQPTYGDKCAEMLIRLIDGQ
jgi:hypothetical protein